MTFCLRTDRPCRFSNSVSFLEALTSGDADCFTSCHPAFVSCSCHFSLAFRARLCGGRGCAVVTEGKRNPFLTVTTLLATDQIQLTSVKILSCNSFGDSQSTSARTSRNAVTRDIRTAYWQESKSYR
jgi:hypothetical protein